MLTVLGRRKQQEIVRSESRLGPMLMILTLSFTQELTVHDYCVENL